MNIKQVSLPDGSIGIEIEDESPKDGSTRAEGEFSYERSEIESYLIDECERQAEESGSMRFLFDTKLTGYIKKKYAYSNASKRDLKLDELLEKGAFHIGTEEDFEQMPSRFSYYDTETKKTCRYEKMSMAISFLKELGFSASEFNYGPEMEQAFIIEDYDEESKSLEKFVIRIQPNLHVNLLSQKDGLESIYKGFFSRSKIFGAIDKNSTRLKQIIREAKLKIILE